MPYPNESAARCIEPSKFVQNSFRRKEITDGVSAIMGHLKNEATMTIQAYRFAKDKFTPEEAKAWLKKNNVKYIDFEPYAQLAEPENVEIQILKSGTFTSADGNDYTFTDGDLQEIADTYNNQSVTDRHDAPLIPDNHEEEIDGQPKPALGFVKKLIAKGSDLFAKILPTPELAQKVRDNAYKKVSAMFYPDNKLLRHVAILGAVVPAVKGLGMLEFSETETENLKKYKFEENIPTINIEEEKKEEELKKLRLFTDLNNKLFIKFKEGNMPNPIDSFQVEFIKKLTETTSSDIGAKAQAIFEELKPTFFPADQKPADQKPADQTSTDQQSAAAASEELKFTEAVTKEVQKQLEAEKKRRDEQEAKISQLEKENRTMKFNEYFDSQKLRCMPAQRSLVIASLEMGHSHNEAIMFSEGDKNYKGEELIKQLVESFPENKEAKAMFNEFANPTDAFNPPPSKAKSDAIKAFVEERNEKKYGRKR